MVLAVLARRARCLASTTSISSSSLPRSLFSPSLRAMSSSAAAGDAKKIYLVKYEYVHDILEKRGPFRAEHLQNALDLKAEGKIIMGGALVDPVDAGVFVFSTDDKSEIERFVEKDPYVQNKLVTSYSIREWMVVV